MKKIVTICTVLTLALAVLISFTTLSLTGCDNGGGGGSTPPDTTPPTVVSVTPSGTGASVAGNVVITFSEVMAAAPGTVELNNTALPGGTWSADKKVFTKPYSGLSFSTEYTIKISGFKDAAGNVMAEKSSSFTTGSTPDTTPPTVLSITPANNSTGVVTTGTVVITFSEIINTAGPGTVSLNGTSFSPGTWSEDKTVLTLEYFNLTPGTTYTVKISEFKDTAGNAMAESTYSFTTAGATPPPITAGLYSKESSNIDPDDVPLVVFDKTSATTAANTFNAAINYVKTNRSRFYILVLDGDVSVNTGSDLNDSGSTVDLSLRIVGRDSNRTISLSSAGSLFTVSTKSQLTLDNNITLKGLASNTQSLVTVNGGSFYMYSGSAITDNILTRVEAAGGGVYVKSGSFTMTGGKISGNKTICTDSDGGYARGGGVYVDTNGTFDMQNGQISGNTCESEYSGYGGGVYVKGKFYMRNNAQISGNTAAGGGGVSVDEGGTFTMFKGQISGNTAEGGGGGVDIYSGTFTMQNGEISDNEAGAMGGGVDIYSGTFTMSGGTISGNTAGDSDYGLGGGVYVGGERGIFTMSNGKISGNKAFHGGGVFVDGGGTFTMEGGEISSNNATGTGPDAGGGGVQVYNGTFTLKNTAVIKDNTAAQHGGGVLVDGEEGIFTMEGGEISSNKANDDGGGVFLNAGTFTMKGGKIYGKDATDGKANIVTDTVREGAAFFKEVGTGTANYASPLTPGRIPDIREYTIPPSP
jgi:hypothetical protein